jgi:hypothetical protein
LARKAVDVTTHRQAWTQRAGVVLALASSALLALPAAPALAAPPDVSNVSASPSSVEAGATTKVQFNLTFQQSSDSANVTVRSNNSKLTCIDGCSGTNINKSDTYSATFKLTPNITANETATITITATDNKILGGQSQASVQVALVGKPQVQTVAEVSGKVTNSTDGKAVSGASVLLRDSQGNEFTSTTGSTGSYRFTGTASKPITPGSLQLGAKKDEAFKSKDLSASAGQRLTNQNLVLVLAAPTASASAEAVPTDTAAQDTANPADTSPPAANAAANQNSGSGLSSWMLIIVGGLLVALGVGAIVLLVMRRKENDADADEGDDEGGPRGRVPASRGAYHGAGDQTRLTNRAGADATMVSRPALADAPTMMHNTPLVDDEFPDPYGAPLPPPGAQPPGYGGGSPDWADDGYGGGAPTRADGSGAAAAGGYGNAPSSGAGTYGNAPSSGAGTYGNAPSSGAGTYGNAPASGGGYRAPAGSPAGTYGNAPGSGAGYGSGRDYGPPTEASGPGYPPPPGGGGYGERYDEPTGRYNAGDDYGPPSDPYDTGAYGQPPGSSRSYRSEQPYGREPEPGAGAGGHDATGGYDQGGGYGGPRAGRAYDGGDGYGAPPDGGYDQRGYGSGAAGYDQPTTGGGYDERPGYGQAPEQRGDGYDNRSYDQGGHYDEPAQGNRPRPDRPRPDGPPEQTRSGRRSLDWLDD